MNWSLIIGFLIFLIAWCGLAVFVRWKWDPMKYDRELLKEAKKKNSNFSKS